MYNQRRKIAERHENLSDEEMRSICVLLCTSDFLFLFVVPTIVRSVTVKTNATRALSTLIASWQPPNPPNGVITSYQLVYSSVTTGQSSLITVNEHVLVTTFAVTARQIYSVRVRASTVKGNGTWAQVVNITADALGKILFTPLQIYLIVINFYLCS